MQAPLLIIIPTHGRSLLLERTLDSLAGCTLPPELRSITVIENGGRDGAEETVRRFEGRLPVEYAFSKRANKSSALNQVLNTTTDEFVLFFDDDVRVDQGNLAAYLQARAEASGKHYFVGPCPVDWEDPPPDWLLRYLPPSARGWSLGNQPVRLDKVDGLGANWGADAADLREVGGFDEGRGPGTVSRGQETDMKERLMAAGVSGYYIPDATVWHYVPKARCNPQWVLERAHQTAIYCGAEMGKLPPIRRMRHLGIRLFRYWRYAISVRCLPEAAPERQFHRLYHREWNRGVLAGIRKASTFGWSIEQT